MIKNIGTIDRTLRVIVGLALIALSVTGTTGPWGWIGIVPLAIIEVQSGEYLGEDDIVRFEDQFGRESS